MIPILGFMNLDNKLILNLNWYSISLKPYTYVFSAIPATKLVHFQPKMRAGFAENGEVGLENEP